MMGSYLDDSVGLVKIQVESSWVNCFRYYKAIIIAAAYPHFVPLGNTVCIIFMEAPMLDNLFLVFSIDT